MRMVPLTKSKAKSFPAANCITVLRMVGTLVLLAMQPLTAGFFWVYTLTGVTDVLDGWVARKTDTVSAFGARLDSLADLLYYAVMLTKLLPVLVDALPGTIWWVVLGIVCVRLGAYLTAALRYRAFASLHTRLNKLTGGAVFLIPYLLSTPLAVGYCWSVCAVAAAASVEELVIHLTCPTCEPDRKSLGQGRRIEKRRQK